MTPRAFFCEFAPGVSASPIRSKVRRNLLTTGPNSGYNAVEIGGGARTEALKSVAAPDAVRKIRIHVGSGVFFFFKYQFCFDSMRPRNFRKTQGGQTGNCARRLFLMERFHVGKVRGPLAYGEVCAVPSRKVAWKFKVVQGTNAMLHREEKDEDLDDFNNLRKLFNCDWTCGSDFGSCGRLLHGRYRRRET